MPLLSDSWVEAIALRMHKAIIKANDLLMLTRDPAHFITSTITNSTTVDNGITYDEYTANITVSGTAPLGGGGAQMAGSTPWLCTTFVHAVVCRLGDTTNATSKFERCIPVLDTSCAPAVTYAFCAPLTDVCNSILELDSELEEW